MKEKTEKDAREAVFMGTAMSNKEVKRANTEVLVDIGKFSSYRWAVSKGTVSMGGRK